MSVLSLALGRTPTTATVAGRTDPVSGGSRASSGGESDPFRPADTVTFSPEALEAAARLEAEEAGAQRTAETPQAGESEGASQPEGEETAATPRGTDGEPLSEAEADQVRELQARDLEVRQHELAHVAAGGPYVTSGPTYEYQQGPDGKRYAVGGNVGIDVSAEDTPEKTIAKAQVVRQAALAPAEPSGQDYRVAAQASRLEQQARAELAEERREETQASGEEATPTEGEATDSQDTPALEQAG